MEKEEREQSCEYNNPSDNHNSKVCEQNPNLKRQKKHEWVSELIVAY